MHEQIKKWYLQATLLIVLGVAGYFIGTRGIFISNQLFEYYSAGIIDPGGPLERYKIYPKSNDVISLLGIMSFISGWFLMFFIYRFTRK